MIEIKNMTLKYPSGKGVFDVNFAIRAGEVTGYLGPNGAGKTTTIRALMGFMRPQSGSCTIGGMDCFRQGPKIHRRLGYIPGEISFIEDMLGDEYLKLIADMNGLRDFTKQKALLERFELVPKGRIKKFSKGMKQKLCIVSAFMHDPDVLILDEPTSGLDPLMQSRFVELIQEEKQHGKTILMSSHIFEEIERTCDDVLIIKEGRIIARSDIDTVKSARRRTYILRTENTEHALNQFLQAGFEAKQTDSGTLEVCAAREKIPQFAQLLATTPLVDLDVKAQTLEDLFMDYYAKEAKQ